MRLHPWGVIVATPAETLKSTLTKLYSCVPTRSLVKLPHEQVLYYQRNSLRKR